jgi:hypothetical protein
VLSSLFGCWDEALLLQRADSLGAYLEGNLLAIDHNGLGLKIRLPNLLGVALREADIAAVLLALAGDFTLLHS